MSLIQVSFDEGPWGDPRLYTYDYVGDEPLKIGDTLYVEVVERKAVTVRSLESHYAGPVKELR